MSKKDFTQKAQEEALQQHLRYQPQIDRILNKKYYQTPSYSHIEDTIERDKEIKKDKNIQSSAKRFDMEILIRNAQEDLNNGIAPPPEYTKLLTTLLCNYLRELNELGEQSIPGLLSKHLHLAGNRDGGKIYYYKMITNAFNDGFNEHKDKAIEGSFDISKEAIESRARVAKKNKTDRYESYFEEGKIFALSKHKRIKRNDLTIVIASYENISGESAGKYYKRCRLKKIINLSKQ